MTDALITVENLSKSFPIRAGWLRKEVGRVRAVNNVSFSVQKGEVLGIVGESGCGKTTLALLLLRLLQSDQGHIYFRGRDWAALSEKDLRAERRHIQMMFQDTYASLNPRMTVADIVAEPLTVHKIGTKKERQKRVMTLLERVGLKQEDAIKYPREFSGGQRQRIGIARALSLNPTLLIADEPTSALDVSLQGEMLNLFQELKEEFGLTYIVISHDLRMIRQIADRIAVMYLGKIVEVFPSEKILGVRHPYTQALLSAVPLPLGKQHSPGEKMLSGELPSPSSLPSGCLFHPRCPYREEVCFHVPPLLERQSGADHLAACHCVHKVPKQWCD